MTRRFAALALSISLVLTFLVSVPAAAVTSAPVPASMAAVGDSITQAASTGGSLGTDAPQNSWSTGTSTTVNSHFLRLQQASPHLVAHNKSVSGAKVENLPAQMDSVVAITPDPGYLTVLIGGNDLCTDTVEEMTSVSEFGSHFTAAMNTITAGSPDTYVYVVSIPDVWQLWNLFKNNFWARFVWNSAKICQSLLANPTSTHPSDVERRAAVRQRNIDYNLALEQICESATFNARCHFDNHAVFDVAFTKNDVSGDYFHPSVAGQAKLALVSWGAGFTWTSSTPQNRPPTAAISAPSECTTGTTCTGFNGAGSSDPDGDPLTYTWEFGDGTPTVAGQTATHTYTSAAGSPYTVTLTVSDGEASTTATASVVVTDSPPPTTGIQLTVSSYKVKGIQHADLTWSGAASTNVDVYRDGAKITTTPNDGAHTDSINRKGGGSYTYKLCEAGTTTCSDDVSVSY